MNADLYFLGDRNYVNGLTIVEEVSKLFRPNYIYAVRFQKFLRGDATFRVTSRQSPSRGECARLDLATQQGDISVLIHENSSEPSPERRPAYDRGIYLGTQIYRIQGQGGEVEGGQVKAQLRNLESSRDLLRALVELMQRATDWELATCAGGGKSYWAWMKDYPVLSDAEVRCVQQAVLNPSRMIRIKERLFFIRTAQVDAIPNPIEFGYFAGVANE